MVTLTYAYSDSAKREALASALVPHHCDSSEQYEREFADGFQAKRMGAFMLDVVINYWGRLISALITSGPAGYYDEVRRAAEAKAAEEARRTGVRHG